MRTGGPGEKRAAVALTHPEDEVKAEEQVFDALSASFDRHGEGWTGVSGTGVGHGRAAGTGGTRFGPSAGCWRLASGMHFLKSATPYRARPTTVRMCRGPLPPAPPPTPPASPRPAPSLRPAPAPAPAQVPGIPAAADPPQLRPPLRPLLSPALPPRTELAVPSLRYPPTFLAIVQRGGLCRPSPQLLLPGSYLEASPFRFSPSRSGLPARALYFGRPSLGQAVVASPYPRPAARTMKAPGLSDLDVKGSCRALFLLGAAPSELLFLEHACVCTLGSCGVGGVRSMPSR